MKVIKLLFYITILSLFCCNKTTGYKDYFYGNRNDLFELVDLIEMEYNNLVQLNHQNDSIKIISINENTIDTLQNSKDETLNKIGTLLERCSIKFLSIYSKNDFILTYEINDFHLKYNELKLAHIKDSVYYQETITNNIDLVEKEEIESSWFYLNIEITQF